MIKTLRKLFLFPYTPSARKGSVLIVSIFMLMLFSILAVGIYRICLARILLSGRLEGLILSKEAAYASCLSIMKELNETKANYHSLYDLQQEQVKDFGILSVVYTMIDEESKININLLSDVYIERLPGIDEDIARAITESPLRPFAAKEEILLLDEVDEELYEEIEDFITVSSNGTVNINTASYEALLSLGMDNDLVETIISFRMGPDQEEATEDDGVFINIGEIIETLKSYSGLFKTQEELLNDLISKKILDVKGESFLLNIETKVLDKDTMKYDIIINAEGLVQWREG